MRVAGVARVDVAGLTKREVRIDLDPARLRAYQITPAQIATQLAAVNRDEAVGILAGFVVMLILSLTEELWPGC